MEILTFMNSHRAVRVRETVVPEAVYKFEPRAFTERGTGMYDRVYHVLTNETTGEKIKISVEATSVLKMYEVVEFNGKHHLGDLYQTAINAHNWSSVSSIERIGAPNATLTKWNKCFTSSVNIIVT